MASASDAKGIERLRRFYGDELVAHGFVASLTQEPFDLTPHVTAVPGWRCWDAGAALRPAARGHHI